jgi:hypothetical protein
MQTPCSSRIVARSCACTSSNRWGNELNSSSGFRCRSGRAAGPRGSPRTRATGMQGTSRAVGEASAGVAQEGSGMCAHRFLRLPRARARRFDRGRERVQRVPGRGEDRRASGGEGVDRAARRVTGVCGGSQSRVSRATADGPRRRSPRSALPSACG